MITQEKLMELIIASLPYPGHIQNLDFTLSTHIRFTWRGDRFMVSTELEVYEVGDEVLLRSNKAIIIEHLIYKTNVLSNCNVDARSDSSYNILRGFNL